MPELSLYRSSRSLVTIANRQAMYELHQHTLVVQSVIFFLCVIVFISISFLVVSCARMAQAIICFPSSEPGFDSRRVRIFEPYHSVQKVT
jgi:hypothetical protein